MLRQIDDETVLIARLAAVAARDLAHDRKAEPRAGGRARARPAIERFEQLLPFGLRDGRSRVAYGESVFRKKNRNRRPPVPECILEKVAQHAAQQARVALQLDMVALEGNALVARALLSGEAEQVDLLAPERRRGGGPAPP